MEAILRRWLVGMRSMRGTAGALALAAVPGAKSCGWDFPQHHPRPGLVCAGHRARSRRPLAHRSAGRLFQRRTRPRSRRCWPGRLTQRSSQVQAPPLTATGNRTAKSLSSSPGPLPEGPRWWCAARIRKSETDKDFDGKTIATPQLGNTQDISARAWMRAQGLSPDSARAARLIWWPSQSGPTHPVPRNGKSTGAWTIEPWVSRLELEAGGRGFSWRKRALWPGRQIRDDTYWSSPAPSCDGIRTKRANCCAAHVEATQWMQ